MKKSTHRTAYRLLSGIISMICLFSVVFGTAMPVSAQNKPLPENIKLLFSETESDYIKLSNEGKACDYTIEGSEQIVNLVLRMSLNKRYEKDQLTIEIPYNGFRERGRGYFSMSNKSDFVNQLRDSASLLYLAEDRSNLNGERGVLILKNKAATAPQIELDLCYKIYAVSVEDNVPQDFRVKITDSQVEGERSPDKVTATFRTHVRNPEVTKSTEDNGLINGCYYAYDEIIEERYHISELYGYDKAWFENELKDNVFIGYKLSCDVEANQPVNMYVDDTPEFEGKVIAVSRLLTYKDCYPFKKVTEGDYSGQYMYDQAAGSVLVLVEYPRDKAVSTSGGENPSITNNVKVTFVGVDGDENDVCSNTATVKSVWQEAGAVYHGDIWSVEKKGDPDPSGGFELLEKGRSVTLGYTIAGIGLTYKYGMLDNFTYRDGPYWMEVVDDAMYANGLGEDGTEIVRLGPDDFNFTTFTLSVKHYVVESVKLNGDVGRSHSMPFEERKPVKVYVMTAESPDEWVLDQEVSTGNGNSNVEYVNEDGDTVFKFKNNNVYRIKFVYENANGDIKLTSKIKGELKGTGSNVKAIMQNVRAQNLENFQVFNWDGQMGYNKSGDWENPTDGGTIYGPQAMKDDLFALDEDLYDGHIADEGNRKITTRLSAKNKISGLQTFSGLTKVSEGISQEDGQVHANYILAAVNGRASSTEDLKNMVDLGIVSGDKEIVFYDLLPEGMSIEKVSYYDDTMYFSDKPVKEYGWEKLWYQYSGHVHYVNTEVPDINYFVADDNYKGTNRQLVKIIVKYKDLPVVKLGEYSDSFYSLGTGIKVTAVADYSELTSTRLDNYAAAQFLDSEGKACELSGLSAKQDDGSFFPDLVDEENELVFSDIDGDGDTTSTTVVADSAEDSIRMYYSATTIIKKIREDEYDTDFKDFTQTYAGHNYTYRIQFFCNVGQSRNIVIFDSIEDAYNEPEFEGLDHWMGKLYGVDISEAQKKYGTVQVYVNNDRYYSEAEMAIDYDGDNGLTPDDLTAENGWKLVEDPDNYDDWGSVKTIAFSIGKDVVFGKDEGDEIHDKSVCVYLKMTAPDSIHENQTDTVQVLAYNAPAYYAEKRNDNGQDWYHDTTIANPVTIGLKSATADMPAVTKTVEGEVPEDFKDSCEFEIKPLDGAEAPRAYKQGVWGDEIKSIKVDVDSETPSAIADDNGSLFFTEPVKAEYEISEKQGSVPYIGYSKEKYKVVFDVKDVRKDVQYDTNTILAVEQKIYLTHDAEGNELDTPVEVNEIRFTNKYVPVPVEFEIPKAVKEIKGDEPAEDETFTFELTADEDQVDDIPMPENTTADVKGSGTAAGFGTVTYTKAGTYRYLITEKDLDESLVGYTKDDTVYTLTVTVTDENGQLKADYVLEKDGRKADALKFVNTYTLKTAEAELEIEKDVEGVPPVEDEEFVFSLTAKDDAPVPSKTKVTISGSGTASFGKWTYKKAGTYVYEVKELAGDNKNCEYDSTVFTVTDTVTDNDSVLTVSRTVTAGDETVGKIVFVNIYTEEDDETTTEEDTSKPVEGDEDSSKTPERDDDSRGGSTEGDSSVPDESSAAAEESSSQAEESSSASDSSAYSKTDSKTGTGTSTATATPQTSTNPGTGSKAALGIETVLLGAVIVVLRKRRKEK